MAILPDINRLNHKNEGFAKDICNTYRYHLFFRM